MGCPPLHGWILSVHTGRGAFGSSTDSPSRSGPSSLISEQEFLARRGDRALRLGFGGSCPTEEVGLVVQRAALRHSAARPAVIAAANLLARWVPNLSVHLPEERTGSLAMAVETAVRTANPFLEIRWLDTPPLGPSLTIGPSATSSPSGLTVWADGWVAICNRRPSPAPSSTPITSVLLFAVTLGVGGVFRDAWRLPIAGPSELRWDTWNHSVGGAPRNRERPPLPVRPPKLGNVLQVGAGAVGSNIIYLLGLIGARADLLVVDHDVVKIENLDRSLLFGLEDAYPQEMLKTDAVLRAVECFPTLRVRPVPSKWAEYASNDYRVGDFDLALALANEDQVWPEMAHAVLPLTLQATTDSDWGVAFGAHAPGSGYCLQCRFPLEAQVAPTICAEGPVEIQSVPGEAETVHASLPFQSAAAAGLLAVEIDKLSLGPVLGAPNYVEAKLDVTERVLSVHRGRSLQCRPCLDFPEELWTAKYGTTKFAHFSQLSRWSD